MFKVIFLIAVKISSTGGYMRSFLSIFLLVLVLVQFVASTTYSQERTDVVYDDSIFYEDVEGWSLGFSIGTLLFDRLDFDVDGNAIVGEGSTESTQVLAASGFSDLTQTVPIPSFTLTYEYRPHNGLSFGIEGSYFQQDHTGVIDSCFLDESSEVGNTPLCGGVPFDGTSRNALLLAGGNYFVANNTTITPYLTADAGVGLNFLKLNSPDGIVILDDLGYQTVIQTGAGFDVDLGPVTLGAVYNYALFGEHFLSHNGQFVIPGDSGTSTSLDVRNEFSLKQVNAHRGELKISIKPGTLRGAK